MPAGCRSLVVAAAVAALTVGGTVRAEAASRPAPAILIRSGHDGYGHAFLIGADGKQLKHAPTDGMVWAPDGRRAAFTRWDGNGFALFVTDDRGRPSAQPILPNAFGFQWAPDGRRIAYRARSDDPIQIVDVRSGRITTIPETGGTSLGAFNWSPDGKRLAFERGDEIWIADADGANARHLTFGERPSWSPDGSRIAFRGWPDSAHSRCIWIAFVETATFDCALYDVDGIPVWSPRGDEIAFVWPNHDMALYVMRADGHHIRRLMTAGLHSWSQPVWSPDGMSIAIAAGASIEDVWVVPLAGKPRRITQGWRYGYSSTPTQWNPRGLPPSAFPGLALPPALGTDSRLVGNTLTTTESVDHLSADGARVVIGYDGGPNCVELWDTKTHRLTRFSVSGCGYPRYCCSLGAGGMADLALAGDRVAWTSFDHFAGLDIFGMATATLQQPRPTPIGGVCKGNCLFPMHDLQGDGDLLVFDTWQQACPHPSFPSPCSLSPKLDGDAWRIDRANAKLIVRGGGAKTIRSVDAGRTLVDEGGGHLVLLDRRGTTLRTFTLAEPLADARLQGSDVVVLRPGAIVDYDARAGSLRTTWPVPADARLEDVQSGFVVYVTGTVVHVLGLRRGRDITFPTGGKVPVRAQLEPSGLFYSWRPESGESAGRVRFVPFARLLQ